MVSPWPPCWVVATTHGVGHKISVVADGVSSWMPGALGERIDEGNEGHEWKGQWVRRQVELPGLPPGGAAGRSDSPSAG